MAELSRATKGKKRLNPSKLPQKPAWNATKVRCDCPKMSRKLPRNGRGRIALRNHIYYRNLTLEIRFFV